MAFCGNCGRLLSNEAVICLNCGAKSEDPNAHSPIIISDPDKTELSISNRPLPPIPPQKTKTRRPLLIILPLVLLAGVIIGVVAAISFMPKPTPPPTPEQQAQSVITSYYAAINNTDYQTAYNLWSEKGNYQTFVNGFADTKHDDYQFGQVSRQSDGTVQVDITLVVTATSSQRTTYSGYYIVGLQSDGTWKIIRGSLTRML